MVPNGLATCSGGVDPITTTGLATRDLVVTLKVLGTLPAQHVSTHIDITADGQVYSTCAADFW